MKSFAWFENIIHMWRKILWAHQLKKKGLLKVSFSFHNGCRYTIQSDCLARSKFLFRWSVGYSRQILGDWAWLLLLLY